MQRLFSQGARLIPARVIVFGFLATLISSFGQTFFIGLFSPQFEAAANVGGARLGWLYGLATLISGTSLFWLGGVIDRISLPRAVVFALVLFMIGCLLAGGMTSQVELFVGFFLLRLGGQGLMSHLGVVTAARNGGERKAKTIAYSSMGVILGEAVLPAGIVSALAVLQWRWVWLLAAAAMGVIVLPTLLFLSHGLHWRSTAPDQEAEPVRIGERRTLLRQPTFWAGLALLLAPPFMATGFLFEQVSITHQMHWQAQLIGAAFTVFALSRALATWTFGHAADRFGALVMTRLHLLPMALAFASLAAPLGAASMWIAFAGLGFTNGANSVLGGAIWVDLFGTASLGLVRGVFTACMVGATAIAPIVLASLLDNGIGIGVIGLGFAAYAAFVPLAAGPILHHRHSRS